MSSVLPCITLAITSRDYSSRAASTNPILRLGFPVVCLCCASEHDIGPFFPMFYHEYGPKDLPTKKIHHIKMEYTDWDFPVVYTLHQRKLKTLPLATKDYKGILLYSSFQTCLPHILQYTVDAQ
ncbi:hypothetical protein DSO57_1000117 [Entomophthora muscae]|uniref:Uncharacterized protein n=1 Tax=Entomophthora muscae TaxID=34485 RepID=A0ACC2SMP0_9FUNG|nr:hypothetical protein DSO57_1000117 [Entomophthora muscae]